MCWFSHFNHHYASGHHLPCRALNPSRWWLAWWNLLWSTQREVLHCDAWKKEWTIVLEMHYQTQKWLLDYFVYGVKRTNPVGRRTDMSPPLTVDEAPRTRESGMALILGASRDSLFGRCWINSVRSQLGSQSNWAVLGCVLCLSCECKGSNGAWDWMQLIVNLRDAKY